MNGEKYAIIADPKSKIWPFVNAVYQSLHARDPGFYLNALEIERFPTNEFKPIITKNVRKRECYYFPDPMQDPSRWFTELCLVNNAIKWAHAGENINVLTYMPFARQDRRDVPRTSISAKVALQAAGYFGATNIMTLDLHSEQAEGFSDVPIDSLYSFPTVVKHLQDNHSDILRDIVFQSTDVGGGKRTARFAKKAGKGELALGYKTRKHAGAVESLKILENIQGRNVFQIDDLLDSGGTLNQNAIEARVQGANRLDAYCTFGIFTKGIDTVVQHQDRLYVSDVLIIPPHPKIEVISMVPLFAEAIYRSSQGEIISEMFAIN